jgi:outer membrane immunogenic protein
MKKLWLAALAGLALSTSVAFAADLGQPYEKAPPPPPPPPGWTGFYIGVNGGGGWNQNTGRSDALGFGNILKPSGGLAGGQIGYNWQSGIVVYGFETDIQWADINDSASAIFDRFGSTYSASQKLDWFGTVRGRIGITAWGDNSLLYVTGGLIYGQQKVAASFADGVTGLTSFNSSSETRTGGTIGVGWEYRFTPAVSAKIEGLWYDMGSTTLGLASTDTRTPPVGFGAAPFDAHFHFQGAIVRAGLNWQFNAGNFFGGGGPGQY